jgi:hypothetical protein
MSKLTPKTPWWESAKIPTLDSSFGYSWAMMGLAVQRLQGGDLVVTGDARGHLPSGVSFEGLVADLEASFPELRLIIEDNNAPGSSDEMDLTYVSEDSAVQVNWDGDSRIYSNIATSNKVLLTGLKNFFKDKLEIDVPKGRVNVIVSGDMGIHFRTMGVAGLPLERGNYEDKVLAGYDRIVSDLNSETPAGRISILNGSAGTGKTHAIRGILAEASETTFVLAPPNMVAELGQPSVLPALMKLHTDRGGSSICFIIEDADSVLAPRLEDNMSAISSILNLSDGILGQLLDIRIIATTNQARQEIDSAILREGRLSASVEIEKLSATKATEVYRRLKGADASEIQEKMTLAEVYSKARNDGWTPAKKETKLGFRSDESAEDILERLMRE